MKAFRESLDCMKRIIGLAGPRFSLAMLNLLMLLGEPALGQTPPTIIGQPESQTVVAGTNVAFTVTATGTEPRAYQWRNGGANLTDGGNISGATTASLTLTNVQSANAGNYDVVVTNVSGNVTSLPAVLTVLTAPAITVQPRSQTVLPGSDVVFGVKATGTPPLSYQWRLNGTNLPGATNLSLFLPAVTAADAGNYTVVVANVAGSTNSLPAVLTVLVSPTITVQPSDRMVRRGEDVEFDVTAAGSQPLSYQWFFNQTIPLAGATNSSLILTNMQKSQAGYYRVTVTNVAGSATSRAAVLTVQISPGITWTNPADIMYGTPLGTNQLNATANVPDSFAYNPPAGTILNAGPGQVLTVTFTPADRTNYTSATATVVLNVGRASPHLVWANPADIVYGTPLGTNQLNATANVPGSFTYNPPAGTILNAGPSQVLTATFSPDDRTNYTGAAATVLLNVGQPLAPIQVRLTRPTNGASFLSGTKLVLLAEVSSSNGTVSRVEFFLDGSFKLGQASSPPFSIIWSNVPAGNYALSAMATDSVGVTGVSAIVSITVTNPPSPPPLAVRITSPANLSSFCPGADVMISATVSNATTATRVEFFVGDTLLGSVAVSPYSFQWLSPSPGDYRLRAKVTDDQGNTAFSSVVQITVSDQCGQVAIVRSGADPEIDTLQAYLFDLRLGSEVYDQSGLTAQMLSSYQIIIWDDLGLATNGLTPSTVDALYAAYNQGIPLYLIGERLASSAASLPEPEHSQWRALTRLGTPRGTGGDGHVPLHSTLERNPILNGLFGTVTNFDYPARMDLATNVDANTEVCGTSDGADVLLAFPGLAAVDTGQTRLFTQVLRVSSPDVPEAEDNLRALFQNVIDWLLRSNRCIDVGLGLQGIAEPEPAQVGQLLEYAVEIDRSGECVAAGVVVTNLLPAGVQFVSAQSEQGGWSYDPVARQVTFSLGHIDLHAEPTLRVWVMPVTAGMITNLFGIRMNGRNLTSDPTLLLVTEVQEGPPLTPELKLQLAGSLAYELSLSGAASVAYEVQTSVDLKTWSPLTNVLSPACSMTARQTSGGSPRLFYRAKLAE